MTQVIRILKVGSFSLQVPLLCLSKFFLRLRGKGGRVSRLQQSESTPSRCGFEFVFEHSRSLAVEEDGDTSNLREMTLEFKHRGYLASLRFFTLCASGIDP